MSYHVLPQVFIDEERLSTKIAPVQVIIINQIFPQNKLTKKVSRRHEFLSASETLSLQRIVPHRSCRCGVLRPRAYSLRGPSASQSFSESQSISVTFTIVQVKHGTFMISQMFYTGNV